MGSLTINPTAKRKTAKARKTSEAKKKPAAKPRKTKPAKSKTEESNHGGSYPVAFAGVTIGEGVARVGVRMDRGEMGLLAADKMFCGRRITGSVKLTKNSDSETPVFEAMRDKDFVVSSTFDVKRLGLNASFYSFGLAFSLQEINIGDLALFAKKTGLLLIDSVEDIPVKADDEDE